MDLWCWRDSCEVQVSQGARQHGVRTVGSVCHLGVLFLVVNILLWVKYLLFCILLLLITTAVVVVHFVLHCFALLINCYFNPYSVLYCPSLNRRGRGKGVVYLECSSLLVSKPSSLETLPHNWVLTPFWHQGAKKIRENWWWGIPMVRKRKWST